MLTQTEIPRVWFFAFFAPGGLSSGYVGHGHVSMFQYSCEKPAVVSCKNAEEYYCKAVEFKALGWTEKAREAAQSAIGLDGRGPIAEKARSYMRTKLPARPVSLKAEQLNIQGYNLMYRDPEQAKAVFAEAIQKYPEFEWPYSNLSDMLISVFGKLKVSSFTKFGNRNLSTLTASSIMLSSPLEGPGKTTTEMLDTDVWTAIRLLHFREGKSKSWIARELGLSRNTVAKYLGDPEPPRYQMTKARGKPIADCKSRTKQNNETGAKRITIPMLRE